MPFHGHGFKSVFWLPFRDVSLAGGWKWEIMMEVQLLSLAEQGCFAVLERNLKLSILRFLWCLKVCVTSFFCMLLSPECSLNDFAKPGTFSNTTAWYWELPVTSCFAQLTFLQCHCTERRFAPFLAAVSHNLSHTNCLSALQFFKSKIRLKFLTEEVSSEGLPGRQGGGAESLWTT